MASRPSIPGLPSGGTGTPERALWASSCAALLVFLCSRLAFGDHAVGAAAEAVVAVTASATAWARGQRTLHEQRGWRWLAVGIAAYGTSVFLYDVLPDAAQQFPSPIDLGLFIFYPATLLAFATLVAARHGMRGTRVWLDAAIGGLALAGATGAILGLPHFGTAGWDLGGSGLALYALGDAFLLGFIITATITARLTAGRSLFMLVAGAAILAAADIGYAYDATAGVPGTATVWAFGWELGLVVLAAAALQPRRVGVPSGDARWARVGVPALSALVTIPITTLLSAEQHIIPLALSALVLVMVVVRLTLTVDARHSAERRLARHAAQQAAVARAGRQALRSTDVEQLEREVLDAVASCLELPREAVAFGPDGVEVGTVRARVEGRERHGVLQVTADRERIPADTGAFLQAMANVLAEGLERAQVEKLIRHQALHDALTGLPNRVLFLDRLGVALLRAQRAGRTVAVLFADLDHFKAINDTYGHNAGDELLVALARRLEATLRPEDTVARFGGDEFTLLCEVVDEEAAVLIAERITEALREPFEIGGNDHFLSASIGIALATGPEDDPETLLRDADAAMYVAKAGGRRGHRIYQEGLRIHTAQRLRIENELHGAAERGELRLLWQPIIDLTDGRMMGVEALVRWQHPQHGLMSPGDFIPVAEHSGLIVPIGEWVLAEACAQGARWHEDGLALRISVNLSPRQLGQNDLVDLLAGILRRTGLPPAALALELTESALMDDVPTTRAMLAELKALGVRLMLDDFGTGYSSLLHLRHHPIDAIKVDRSFVAELGASGESAAIVEAVVAMGRSLALEVIAEGVERPEHVQRLRALGCGLAQGYLFAPPLPAEEIGARAAADAAPPIG